MPYTVVIKLAGPLAGAAAVEWTDVAAPQGSGSGWEPCLRLGDGRWRLSSHDLTVVRPRHWRDPGLFPNIGIRYRLTAGGPWSPVSASRKEITIVALTPEEEVPPAVVGELFDEVFDEDTGPQEVETAAAFSGANLRFSVTGAGASVDPATGLVSIPTGTPVDGARVTVTASNSGGSASLSFLVTVEAASPDFPAAVPDARWTAVEVTSPAEAGNVAGRRKATLDAAATVPAGFALHIYLGSSADAAPSTSLPTLAPGGTVITDTPLAVGATCRPRLYWRRLEDGLFQAAGEKTPFTIQGLTQQPGGFPRLAKAMVDDLLGRPLTDFGPYSGAGSNSGYFGAVLPLLAANSFAGDTSSDARLLQNLRHNVSAGHDPTGHGGFTAQLELNFAVATAIARLTPRVWNQLTAAERTRLDIAMKGQLVANAFTSSDTNPYFTSKTNPQKNLRGGTAWRTGNPNFRCAAPAAVHAVRVFLGSNAAVTEFLDNFNMSSFATLAQSNKLPGLYETYRTVNRPSDRPSAAQVQAAIKNWKNQGFGIADITGLFVHEANFTAGKTIEPGYNNGAGIAGRGKLMAGAAGLPNRGQVGMYHEFDSSDAGGVRSSASYCMFGARVILNWALVLCVAGLLDRKAASVQAMRERLDRAQTDLKYKSDHGYLSYSKGGEGGNNENWTSALADQWGWSYTFGTWTHILKPYLKG